jgi:hypothetical protein
MILFIVISSFYLFFFRYIDYVTIMSSHHNKRTWYVYMWRVLYIFCICQKNINTMKTKKHHITGIVPKSNWKDNHKVFRPIIT